MSNQANGIDDVQEFNQVFSSLPTTIFEAMSQLASRHASINLGQGFPDRELEGPQSLKAEISRSLAEESNQYPSMMGIPELRQAIAAHSHRHAGLMLDWTSQTLVTLGATEALAAAFLGLLNPGDEVILFAPLYDSYVPMIRRAGANPVIIPLHPPTWSFQSADLTAAFNERTKLVVINTPHNPTGKVFTIEELEMIARCMANHPRVVAILDEVYEHLVFPGYKHVTMRSLQGMDERCMRIGSAGKTFSFTDFKVGWCTGSPGVIKAVAKAHQFLTFTVNSAIQRAVAHGLNNEEEFYLGLGGLLAKKRELLQQQLESIGFTLLPAHGTYFLVADFSNMLPLFGDEATELDDVDFCFKLTKEAGVTLIPVSAFYEDKEQAPKTLVRFVTCKTDEKLHAAAAALEKYFAGLRALK